MGRMMAKIIEKDTCDIRFLFFNARPKHRLSIEPQSGVLVDSAFRTCGKLIAPFDPEYEQKRKARRVPGN
jgi:hypothetical protein